MDGFLCINNKLSFFTTVASGVFSFPINDTMGALFWEMVTVKTKLKPLSECF